MDGRYEHGFTLIELSLVLAIIGLLVGGVLTGRDLIHSAELRKTISQKTEIEAGVNAFRVKYNCLPGDCVNATALGFTGGDDDGDGVICTNGDCGAQYWFWEQMYEAGYSSQKPSAAHGNAGLVRPGTSTPRCPICDFHYNGYFDVSVGGWLESNMDYLGDQSCGDFGASGGEPIYATALLLTSNALTGSTENTVTLFDAWSLDSKLDDGMPFTGALISVSYYYWAEPGCGTPTLHVATGTSAQGYDVNAASGPQVDVIMRANF